LANPASRDRTVTYGGSASGNACTSSAATVNPCLRAICRSVAATLVMALGTSTMRTAV
jgi:hypothetical protein